MRQRKRETALVPGKQLGTQYLSSLKDSLGASYSDLTSDGKDAVPIEGKMDIYRLRHLIGIVKCLNYSEARMTSKTVTSLSQNHGGNREHCLLVEAD